MLFVEDTSLIKRLAISIHGNNDKDETHIVTARCKEKQRMDVISEVC